MNQLVHKSKTETGQGLVEYAIMIVMVAVVVLLSLHLIGISVGDAYCAAANAVSGGNACGVTVTETDKFYCRDDFSDGIKDWKSLQGQPAVKDQKFCWSGNTQIVNTCSMDSDLEDYVIRLGDVVFDKGSGYGVFFRTEYGQQGLFGYIFQLDTGLRDYPNGAFLIRRWVNGREVVNPIAISGIKNNNYYNTTHDVEIIVKGNTFTVRIDGNQVLQATDSASKSGGVGLRSWYNSTMCMSRFSVDPIQ